MQNRLRWLFAMLVVLLPAAMGTVFLHSAEPSRRLPAKSPFTVPVDMNSTADFHAEYLHGAPWDQSIKVRYQWDGETAYATETIKNSKNPKGERSSRTDYLYRAGELVRFQSELNGTKTEHFMAVFVSPTVSATQRPSTAGEIFDAYQGGSAVAGYFDGYFYDDYFLDGGVVKTEEIGKLSHVSSRTKLGSAQAWLDSTKGYLPQRLLIQKGPDDYTTAGRTLGSVRFDGKQPESALLALNLEIKDVEYNHDREGRFYIQKCTELTTKTSQRGIEAKETVKWTVDAIKFNPAFNGGRIYPDLPIADGLDVYAQGAPQLPFRWSQQARWVVPAANALAATNAGRAGIFGARSVFILVNIGMLTIVLALWLYRRGRSRHGT